jgi:signal transduction histidine kinase
MQKRADELGADFNIHSNLGKGCLISLKVKSPDVVLVI